MQDPTGAEVCDAVVTATDGGYSEVLSAGGTAQDCAYVGALERSGTYTLTAKVGVVFGTGPSAKVRSDECHVITENVTIDLGA